MSRPPVRGQAVRSWVRAGAISAVAVLGSATAVADPGGPETFERHVRPLLLAKCVSCHGAEEQESNLRLDSAAGLAAGGDSGEPLLPAGTPLTGLLWRAVNPEDDSIQMPPAGGLTPEEVGHLRDWVAAGAPWPEAVTLKPQSLAERIADQKARHWSLRPVRVADPGPPLDPAKVRTGVDRYVQGRLRQAGAERGVALVPGPEADRRTLIGRVTFDLTGLPPTAEEVDAFAADDRPDAYGRLVDRLLASPAYGERWARHWLDVARFADTKGYAFQKDNRYPHAWTYRDYVIRAFNDDLPYDRFLTEQLAADRLGLPEHDPRLAALGFLTVGRKFNNDQEDVDDKIDVVTRGVLGLTVACARCHDHKYDGIPTADYYSLYGVFASSDEPEDLPTIDLPLELTGTEHYQAELAKREAEKAVVVAEIKATAEADLVAQTLDYFVHALAGDAKAGDGRFPGLTKAQDELRRPLVRDWGQDLRRRVKPTDPLLSVWAKLKDVEDDGFAEALDGWIASVREDAGKRKAAGDDARTAADVLADRLTEDRPAHRDALLARLGAIVHGAAEAWSAAGRKAETLDGDARLLLAALNTDRDYLAVSPEKAEDYVFRGERDKLRAAIKKIQSLDSTEPGAPPRAMVVREVRTFDPYVMVRGNPGNRGESIPRRFPVLLAPEGDRPAYATGGRRELAEDIVRPSNPLTARVIVDRVWMHHFGTPLVGTPGDFGLRSEAPVQGPLLDHLADRLVRGGWSLKDLHREILLSHTYRQSSRPSEAAAAADPDNGLLTHQNRRRLEWEPLRDRALASGGLLDRRLYGRSEPIHTEALSRRRTLYGTVDRQDMPGLFRVFNFPNPDSCTPRRPDTTVPQQGLFWLNSPVIRAAGEAVADDVLRAEGTPARVERLYRAVLQRAPTAEEADALVRLVDALAGPEPDAARQHQTWRTLAQTLLMTNEFAFID